MLNEAVGGDLSKIERIPMVRGYVNAADDFALPRRVVDEASELIVEELGEKGQHARTSLGCATLPNRNCIALEAMAILKR